MYSGFMDNVLKKNKNEDDMTVQERISAFLSKVFGISESFSNNVIEHLNPELLEKNSKFATDLVLTVCSNIGTEASWNAMTDADKQRMMGSSAAALVLDGSQFQNKLRLNAIEAMTTNKPGLDSGLTQGDDMGDTIMPKAPSPDF